MPAAIVRPRHSGTDGPEPLYFVIDNHELFFNIMGPPDSSGDKSLRPVFIMHGAIQREFGSLDLLKQRMHQAATEVR